MGFSLRRATHWVTSRRPLSKCSEWWTQSRWQIFPDTWSEDCKIALSIRYRSRFRHHQMPTCCWTKTTTASTDSNPAGLCTRNGKRPDGLSLIPWQNGKPLAWDVTVASTLAESYVEAAARESGAVAEQAAQRKVEKYRYVFPNYCFQPCFSTSQSHDCLMHP